MARITKERYNDSKSLQHANGLYGKPDAWQTARDSRIVFQNYYSEIMNLALSRFKWINLPKTCDERYLEWVLMTQGAATIAFPERAPGEFLSLMMVWQSAPNIYDNPAKWRAMGQNGSRFNCDNSNGVVIFDNIARYPMISKFEFWASELTDIFVTRRINRLHQKVPFALIGEPNSELELVNLFKQIDDGEPAIIAYKNLVKQVEKIDTEVPYIGTELDLAEQNSWNRIYRELGIASNTMKMERQIEDEVINNNQPNDLHRLNPLQCRRAACAIMNDRFEEYLDAPLDVVWNKDITTENYNYIATIEDVMSNE